MSGIVDASLMTYLRYSLAVACLLAGCKFPELPDITDADGDAVTADGDTSGDGSSDGTPPIDAPYVNALGQVCTSGQANTCPEGNDCISISTTGGGSLGPYCSPMCMNDNARCTTGYTGPASGMPVCAVGDGTTTNYCAIICVNNSDCPTGLTCQTFGNPPTSVCAS
jgi:hypothetical protein